MLYNTLPHKREGGENFNKKQKYFEITKRQKIQLNIPIQWIIIFYCS